LTWALRHTSGSSFEVLNPPTVTLYESDLEWRREALRELALPREIAPLDDLRVGADGTIWVRRGTSPADSTATWQQFDPTGHSLRSVALPAGLRVEAITSQAIYGVILDEFGVQYVARFPMG
jgi:hypothetical protein